MNAKTTRILLRLQATLKRVGFALLVWRTAMQYLFIFLVLTASLVHAQDVIWVRNGDTANSYFGAGLYPLGDQNDDGFDDWAVVSADGFDFFFGGSPPGSAPYLSFRPRQNPPQGMHNFRSIGDINGDGYEDWWVFYYPPGSDSVSLEIFGGGVDADTIPECVILLDYDAGDDYGDRVGDHNGDGFDDFYYFRRGLDQATFYLGNADWNLTPSFTNRGEPIGSGNSFPSPNTFGDFNGDGYDDYLVQQITGIHDSTLFYLGSADPDTIADLVWFGNFAFPATLSADLNGDGAADLAVGGQHTVAVHLGGVAPSPVPTFVLDIPGCPEAGTSELSSAGDFNRDGFEDLLMMSRDCENGFGAMELYLGGFWLNADPVLRVEGLSSPPFDDVPITRAVGIGDVNGDGIDDLAIGCSRDRLHGGRRGRVIILSGDTTLHVPVGELPPIAQELSLSVYPNPANGYINIELPAFAAHKSNVEIFNLLGQRVDQLTPVAETTSLHYDVSNLSSGIYIVHAKTKFESVSGKLVVMK